MYPSLATSMYSQGNNPQTKARDRQRYSQTVSSRVGVDIPCGPKKHSISAKKPLQTSRCGPLILIQFNAEETSQGGREQSNIYTFCQRQTGRRRLQDGSKSLSDDNTRLHTNVEQSRYICGTEENRMLLSIWNIFEEELSRSREDAHMIPTYLIFNFKQPQTTSV